MRSAAIWALTPEAAGAAPQRSCSRCGAGLLLSRHPRATGRWPPFMISWPNFVSQLFNGLALGALLALISSGLTIIYGTLGVLNLAHGAMFMLGGYGGYVAYQYSGSFVVAVIAGS